MTAADWETLRATALVGTARRPLDGFDAAGRSCGSGESAVLHAAALLGVQRRAGVRFPVADRRTEPAARDSRPAAPARPVQLLDLLIGAASLPGRDDELLRHWVRQCDAARFRLPDTHLVAVLDAFAALLGRDQHTTDAAVRIIGERGRWMVSCRPERWSAWHEPLAGDENPPTADLDSWDELDVTQRRAVIAAVARTEPGRARRLIADEWANQKAAGRAQLLEVLEASLTPADEALLEQALDGRAKSVRLIAQRMLAQLPSSRRSARAAELLAGLISPKRRFSRALELSTPPLPTDADVRWGLADPDRPDSAPRFLSRLIAAAPLRVWTDAGHQPVAVVQALAEPDQRAALVSATVAQRNVEFAELLLGEPNAEIPALLPPERLLWMIERLPADTPPLGFTRLIGAVPVPWSEPVARTIGKAIRSMKEPASHARTAAGAIRAGGSAAVLPDLEAILQQLQRSDDRASERDERAIRRTITNLSTSRSITEAFR